MLESESIDSLSLLLLLGESLVSLLSLVEELEDESEGSESPSVLEMSEVGMVIGKL
jgi:hypothetical protein